MLNRSSIIKLIFFSMLFSVSFISLGQNDTIQKPKSIFWQKVRFGGGLGLNLGNGFTNVSVSPTLYYPLNEKVTIGSGLNISYIKNRDVYNSWIYGGSAIAIFNPIDYIQLSTELEQLRVNINYPTLNGYYENNFWNTALFLGVGYRTQNITFGVRYNVLHKNSNNVYTDAWMPFVRIMF